MQTGRSKQIYLDHNSTSPMEQSAIDALLFFLSSEKDDRHTYGNASSIHWAGRIAKKAVEDAREEIALSLQVDPTEICFTGSATEATNLALQGFFFHEHPAKAVHFISTEVEHEATLQTLAFLKGQGAGVHLLGVDGDGRLNLENLEQKLSELSAQKNIALMVSVMAANNETGVLFPWVEIANLARKYGAQVHLDAVQLWGKIAGFQLGDMPVDFVSLSGHKIGGPKGIGVLWLRRGAKLSAIIHGGAQERKRRAGTTNVPAIAGFGAAAKALSKRDFQGMERLRDSLEAQILARIPGTQIMGKSVKRIINTSNILFDGVRGEGLVMGLDMEGMAVSSGSACNSGSISPSHVLLAMGHDAKAAASAVRISLGPSTKEQEITDFISALERVVARIRNRKS